MGLRRGFCRSTVKRLTAAWQRALQRGDRRVVQRATALLRLAAPVPVPAVAARVGAGGSTVYGWLQACLHRPFARRVDRTAPGRPARLTPAQQGRLRALVSAGPAAAGDATGCWHSAVSQELIQCAFGVRYSVQDVAELLGHLGCSSPKARFVSDHRDAATRAHWCTRAWPAILRAARRRGARRRCGDAASVAQWGARGSTWAPRGQQPLVATGGRRQGDTVCGLLDSCSGRRFCHGHDGRFTAARSCAFLGTVLAATARPLVLVQDGARYHTATDTQAFVARHAARLTVHPLPAYSPDYHPIAHRWRTSTRQNTHHRSFPAFADLTVAVEAALAHFRAHPAEIRQLLGTYLDRMAALTAIEAAPDALAPAA